MKRARTLILLAMGIGLSGLAADNMVATAVYGRVGNGYKREKAKDGSFKPEFYALSNGGLIAGTMADITVDRVTYPEVAEIATRFLAQQNYRYARDAQQAQLLVVLQWGNTVAFDRATYSLDVNDAGAAMQTLARIFGPQGMGSLEIDGSSGRGIGVTDANARAGGEGIESAMLRIMMDNRLRDQINTHNSRVLGYMDDLADSNDIRRWAGGGDRYTDLITDVEETRYYIVVSAYDFAELTKHQKKKLLWQTRVSVRSVGNRFDEAFVPMFKSAARYFGQDSGRLVRGEESKGTVELGDLKFLGEAKDQGKKQTKENNK